MAQNSGVVRCSIQTHASTLGALVVENLRDGDRSFFLIERVRKEIPRKTLAVIVRLGKLGMVRDILIQSIF